MRRRYRFEDNEDFSDQEISLDPRRNRSNNNYSIYHVSSSCGIVVVILLLAILWAVIEVDNNLPTGLYLSDEKKHPDRFIADRARHDLQLLTKFGPRVAGSYENEILAVDFLNREILFIIQRAHKNQKIETDVQITSGSYFLHGEPFGKYNSYANVQNVVVKLYGSSPYSVLLNVHFDSVPTSPGGSDDGINCVAALEILRKISKSSQRPLHSIVFLFNGAEETGLHASHGFITQHQWANNTKAVINLEAAGHGGKCILFQTGPRTPWIIDYYMKVPYPYGQAAGEEIFQSGIIPSDTDFRIFRDYGGLVGVDMAFYKKGYRYHTKYDDFEHIPLGSYQHVGDNALTLVKEIANASELGQDIKGGNVVYFDFLGIFMIAYPEETGTVVNILIVLSSFVISIVSIRDHKLNLSWNNVQFLILSLVAVLGGWILSAIAVLIVGKFLDMTGYSMSWYGHPWMVVGLFCAPTVICSSFTTILINHMTWNQNIQTQIQVHLTRIIWSLIVLIGIIFGIRSSYFIALPVLFMTLPLIFIHAFRIHDTLSQWKLIYLLFLLVPIIFVMYSASTILQLFIPITGRAGSDKNFDVLIGILTWFATTLAISPLIPLVKLLRKVNLFFIFLGAIFFVTFILVFTPLGFPYSGDSADPTPQRYWTLHTKRVFYGENGNEIKRDSGFFLLNMDRNSPAYVRNYVKEINSAKDFTEDCKKFLLCGFPLAHPKMVSVIKASTWIPAPQPLIPQQIKLDVLSKETIAPNVTRYNVSISGPDRIMIYLSPMKNHKIFNLSLADEFPIENTLIWNDRPLFMAFHIWGKTVGPCIFTFDIEDNGTGPTTEIGLTGIYVHEISKTASYMSFLKQFPDWADLTAWVGSVEVRYI